MVEKNGENYYVGLKITWQKFDTINIQSRQMETGKKLCVILFPFLFHIFNKTTTKKQIPSNIIQTNKREKVPSC